MKRRILFVDDEPNVLQGLKRMLRGMRNEWEMSFAESGPEALETMTKEHFDVVVSDMRMPGMDGAQLLSEVKKRHPHVVRIVLSGQSDKEMVLKSVRPAHQYLSKPCDADTLKSSVSRACALRDILSDNSLKQIISQVDALPSMPSIYSEIMEELQTPDASINKIGQIIAKDLGMTTKILQLVNSAFFGIPRHISSPEQAVSLLGLDTVKALVLTVGVFSKFDKIKLSGFSIEKLWTHSTITGTYSKEIAKAENIDKNLIDDSFMAGLLHDVGKLVLASSFSDSLIRIVDSSRDQNLSFYEAEYQILGTTHAEIGAYLLGLWGLPNSIVEAVAFHHMPQNFPDNIFNPLAAIHFADALEYEGHLTSTANIQTSRIDYEYLGQLGLDDHLDQWRKVCEQVKQEARHD